MASPRPIYDRQHINTSELMQAGSQELSWYNAITPYPPGKFTGKTLHGMRNQRAAEPSLNLFQRFSTDIVCAVKYTLPKEQQHTTFVSSSSGATLKFSIGGGTEIPHFQLQLQLRLTAKEKSKQCIFTIIWTAWNESRFESRRAPTYTMSESSKFTFSDSLKDVTFVHTKLNERSAKACTGTAGSKAFEIGWTSHTLPSMMEGFNISNPELEKLFSKEQIQTFRNFQGLCRKDISLSVITRVNRDEMEQNRKAKMFSVMKAIPAITDRSIVAHHQSRLFGWQNMERGGFDREKSKLLQHMHTPFTTYINEREYETIQMIGLLREAEAQKKTVTAQFDQFYDFDLFRAADVHGSNDNGLDPYFYAVVEAKFLAKGAGDTDAQQVFEQDMPLPEPGTPLKFSIVKNEHDKNNIWEGIVVSSRGIPRSHLEKGGKEKFNAICIRLKRPLIQESTGIFLHLAGYIMFGSPGSQIVQARSAIRYAMWGNDDFGVARDNKIKRLLLAHDNSTIKYHRTDNLIDRTTLRFLEKSRIPAIEMASRWRQSNLPSLTENCGTISSPSSLVHREQGRQLSQKKLPLIVLNGVATMQMPQESNINKDVDDQDEDVGNRSEAMPVFVTDVEKDLKERGVDDNLQKIVLALIDGITDLSHQCTLGFWLSLVLKAVMAGQKAILRVKLSDEKMECLWKFITFQELLRRQEKLATETASLESDFKSLVLGSKRRDPQQTPGVSREWIIKEQKRAWLKLQQLYLRTAKIVLCTASTAGRKSLRGFRPDFLVVEEASQMIESQALNAMMRHLPSLKKVILSGDASQLPPTVISSASNECFDTQKVSLFERLIRTGHPHIQLQIQYRMAPDICKHAGLKFGQKMAEWFKAQAGCSYFVSVGKSTNWHRRGSTSILNPEYVQFICDLCLKFVKDGASEKRILVLSFYNEERLALTSMLHETLGLKDIQVKSIDASQGTENTFVILSTTRVGGNGGIGFVQDCNRQCVALSRARDGLVVVGNEYMATGRYGANYDSLTRLIGEHGAQGRLIRAQGDRSQVFAALHIIEEEWEKVQ
ncbi:hypothetical protein N7495_009709 [Penicillium taxi]|uniref:uncharacterized protein n=1 Tax=Penicillium taxi TaxID=168475 RepID=UPI0025451792|nr:uncharacterized protein N7495_009709 [Penicillium taxi]KAJ5885199.1 hypothetical protein N7495_009709 [Penicillium taxi]